MSYEVNTLFEDEVRRIARAKWPKAEFDGAAMIDGRERDGLFETDETIHFIEATTSKRSEKARDDTKKIFQLISSHQKSGSIKGAIGWFITQSEPTADQREAVRKHGKNQVKAVSFAQFQQSIIDVNSYFSKRENHLFGSITDPRTGEIKYKGKYIKLDLFSVVDNTTTTLDKISTDLPEGSTYVILGEYGAGKSMTLREVYFKLRDVYRKGSTSKFPVYINLREHSGQDDPSELLERHARKIGFDKPSNLVSAWRAGFVILLIDGFDEITSLGISVSRSRLREARRRSLEAVRRLLEQTPSDVGYIVAGREHFFSSSDERKSTLSLRQDTITIVLGELNRAQVDKYIENITGSKLTIPAWLPTRPLLVSYLAHRGILEQSENILSSIDAIDGWDILLDKIFERESKISPSLDGPTLRSILERLSTIARSTSDGLGPITQENIRNAYIQICESEPDDQANLLLQRLPGLGLYRHEDESRTFIDYELAGICRAKDISSFIENPYGMLQDDGWLSSMRIVNDFVGKSAIIKTCRNFKNTIINIDSSFQSLKNTTGLDILKTDLAIFCMELPCEPKSSLLIENTLIENYDFYPTEYECNLSRMKFKNCIFESITIGNPEQCSSLPKFESCLFMKVNDRTCKEDLPQDSFNNKCEFEKFAENTQTQSAILGSSISTGEKLILTILRKVFIQSLSGRSETALIRGLDLNVRPYVDDAIKLLQQHELLMLYNKGDGNIWIPIRKELNRVRRILGSPSTCNDQLLTDAKKIAK